MQLQAPGRGSELKAQSRAGPHTRSSSPGPPLRGQVTAEEVTCATWILDASTWRPKAVRAHVYTATKATSRGHRGQGGAGGGGRAGEQGRGGFPRGPPRPRPDWSARAVSSCGLGRRGAGALATACARAPAAPRPSRGGPWSTSSSSTPLAASASSSCHLL